MESDREMEMESDSQPSGTLVLELKERNAYLRKRLNEEQNARKSAVEVAKKWQRIAGEEHKTWQAVHDAMNVLSYDANRVMEEHGAAPLHRELTAARELVAAMRRKLELRLELTRRSVEEMSLARQQVRDYEELTEELNKRLAVVEGQRDDAVKQAEEVISRKQAALERIAEYASMWERGEMASMEALAGICSEAGGYPIPESGSWARRKAVQQAQLLSQHYEMSDQLAKIEALIGNVGVDLVNTHVNQVKDLVRLFHIAEERVVELQGELRREKEADWTGGAPSSKFFDQLVGATEAGEIIGVTRQRASQLASEGNFPLRASLRSGPVFWKPDVVEFAKQPRPTGRPAKKEKDTA